MDEIDIREILYSIDHRLGVLEKETVNGFNSTMSLQVNTFLWLNVVVLITNLLMTLL